MSKHTVRTAARSRSVRALLGAVTAVALTAGLFTSSASAAPVAGADTVSAAAVPAGIRFRIVNQAEDRCASHERAILGNFVPSLAKSVCPGDSTVWLQGSGNSIRHPATERQVGNGTHFCLDSDGSQRVYVEPCNGGNYQKWTRYSEGFIKNWATKQCLDIDDDLFGELYTRECLKHEAQKWDYELV
ncbi:RICIN domain-containing protein [Streptomyces sp. YS415]|uniref:RICIN domain-containing protein n=1 Tax=Streptomyces sp. YS415 TaxID=2944806 RepID=UPI00201FBBFB|nr:RICIN domain-containing protein [Streptomyces sp. YS415]MCL7430323.1 ricin-type beta-trefoil lectin domain protein [Streptomyces sp. YS415]